MYILKGNDFSCLAGSKLQMPAIDEKFLPIPLVRAEDERSFIDVLVVSSAGDKSFTSCRLSNSLTTNWLHVFTHLSVTIFYAVEVCTATFIGSTIKSIFELFTESP